MVRLQGFEPGTYGLEVRCSIQLSYRRKSLEAIKKNVLINSFEAFVKPKQAVDRGASNPGNSKL